MPTKNTTLSSTTTIDLNKKRETQSTPFPNEPTFVAEDTVGDVGDVTGKVRETKSTTVASAPTVVVEDFSGGVGDVGRKEDLSSEGNLFLHCSSN